MHSRSCRALWLLLVMILLPATVRAEEDVEGEYEDDGPAPPDKKTEDDEPPLEV